MPRITQLYEYHKAHSKLTEFAGYDMPLWYTTTSQEHLAVRNSCGIFDVSHMGRVRVEGERASQFLEGMVPTKVQLQPNGRSFYTLLLNEQGGIIDDLIINKISDSEFLVVVNAANAVIDLKHLKAHMSTGVQLREVTDSSVMIAVQGPTAQEVLQPFASADLSQLKRFRSIQTQVMGVPSLVSRTGYTGEDGFEVVLFGPTIQDPERGLMVWEKLVEKAAPCGLGARDSLRLEAGLPLHGSDIGPDTDPFQAGLSWVITEGKDNYFGSSAIQALKGKAPEMVKRGLVLNHGIPRHGFGIFSGESNHLGVVTSGTFSPILRKGIALCRVGPDDAEPGSKVMVSVRDTREAGILTDTPFYDQESYGWRRSAQH